jgi:hypothetical protein
MTSSKPRSWTLDDRPCRTALAAAHVGSAFFPVCKRDLEEAFEAEEGDQKGHMGISADGS